MTDPQSSDPSASRSKIIRDVFVFQVKLWLEGFKDVVLIPLSLGAAFVDLVFRHSAKRGTLYSVMKVGDRFERWVDLYAALEQKQDERRSAAPVRPSLDDVLHKAEAGHRMDSSLESRKTNTERNRS